MVHKQVDTLTIGRWFQERGIESAAMESTRAYWIPTSEYLESIGVESCLISAAAMKKVPGRKMDLLDSQWIQTLHSYVFSQSLVSAGRGVGGMQTLLRHGS